MPRLLFFVAVVLVSVLAVVVRLIALGIAVPYRNAHRLYRVASDAKKSARERKLEPRTSSLLH